MDIKVDFQISRALTERLNISPDKAEEVMDYIDHCFKECREKNADEGKCLYANLSLSYAEVFENIWADASLSEVDRQFYALVLGMHMQGFLMELDKQKRLKNIFENLFGGWVTTQS